MQGGRELRSCIQGGRELRSCIQGGSTANQYVNALTQRSISILPIPPFKFKLETSNFKMNMNRATKMYKWVGEVKPKAKTIVTL